MQKNNEIIRKKNKKNTTMMPSINTENLLFNSENINKNIDKNIFRSTENLNNIFVPKNQELNSDMNNNRYDIQKKPFNRTKYSNIFKTVTLSIEDRNRQLLKSSNIEKNIPKEKKINSPKSENQEINIKPKINKPTHRISSSHPFTISKKILKLDKQNKNEQTPIYQYKEREIDIKKKNRMKMLHTYKSENNLSPENDKKFKTSMKWEDLNEVEDYDRYKNIDFNGVLSIKHYEPTTTPSKIKLKKNFFSDEKDKNIEKEKYTKSISVETKNKMANAKIFKNPGILNAMTNFKNSNKFGDHDNGY